MTTARSATVLAAAACLAVLAAGCASHGTTPGPGATRSPGSSATAAPSAAASTPATPAPVTTAPAGQGSVRRCHTTQLSMAFTGLNAASGGQRGMTLILTDHSGTTCHVYGYPGLAFIGNVPMATHLTWVKETHAAVVLRPGGNAQALLTWRANTATGPAPFNPVFVHITPPDERVYLHEVWPGGPVLNGEIAAWPLRAALAGPFPAGTGTVASPFNGICMTVAADGRAVVAWKCNPGAGSSNGPDTATARCGTTASAWTSPARRRRQGQGGGVHRGGHPEVGHRPDVRQRFRQHLQHRDRRRPDRPRRQYRQRHPAGHGARKRRPELPVAGLLPPLPEGLTARQAALRPTR